MGRDKRAFSSAVERFSDKEEVDGPTPSVPTRSSPPTGGSSMQAVLKKKGRRGWRYSSFKRFFLSSKIILNLLKNSSLPKRLKETKYSWEKTIGHRNILPATSIFISWI